LLQHEDARADPPANEIALDPQYANEGRNDEDLVPVVQHSSEQTPKEFLARHIQMIALGR
jgi:amino acid permease